MKYSDIKLLRQLPTGEQLGLTFQHVRVASHVFTTQYPMGIDKPELSEGRLERSYTLKLVGRSEGGHLFRNGFAPRVFQFSGMAHVVDSCMGVDEDTAMQDSLLLYEFLRGDVESQGCSENNPDPRIRIGAGSWESQSGKWIDEFIDDRIGDIDQSFADAARPDDTDGGSPDRKDGELPEIPHLPSIVDANWLSSYYILEPDTFSYEKPKHQLDQLVKFSFAMRQIPRNTILT